MTQKPRRESWQILQDAFKRLGFDAWARFLNLSKQSLYKWSERSGKDEELPFEPSGRLNPFDRVEQIVVKLQAEGQQDLLNEISDWFMRLFGRLSFSADEIEEIKAILERAAKPGRRKS